MTRAIWFVMLAALGCGNKKQATPGSNEAAPGSNAGAPGAPANDKGKPDAAGGNVLAKFGAKGSNVYAEQLIARDDGGFVLSTELLGSATFGSTTIKAKTEERADAAVALDATGKVRWAHGFDGQCSGMHMAASGTSTFVAGSCVTPIDGPSGPVSPVKVDKHVHVFTAMLDDSGAVKWAKYAGNAGHQVANGAALDASGNSYVVGWFADPINFGTGLLVVPKGHRRAGFIASFDPTGKARWVKTYADAEVNAILASPDELEVAGVFTNETTIGKLTLRAPTIEANKDRKDKGGRFFARLSPDTGEPASAAVVDTGASMGQDLARDASGTIYDAADSLDGLVLFAIDKDNKSTRLHVIPIHGFALMGARPLVLDGKGRLLVELSIDKPMDFGGGKVEPTGTGDVIVLAFDRTGAFAGQTVLQAPGQDSSGGLAVGKDGVAVAAWVAQAGPAGQRFEEWSIADTFYVSMLQKVSP